MSMLNELIYVYSPLKCRAVIVNRPSNSARPSARPSIPIPIISVTNGAIKGGILITVAADRNKKGWKYDAE